LNGGECGFRNVLKFLTSWKVFSLSCEEAVQEDPGFAVDEVDEDGEDGRHHQHRHQLGLSAQGMLRGEVLESFQSEGKHARKDADTIGANRVEITHTT